MCQEFETTEFLTIPITETLQFGIPIGVGACKAVRLKLNVLQRNTTDFQSSDVAVPFLIYYGDTERQEAELISYLADPGAARGIGFQDWTPLIYCRDLSEVFIRYGGASQAGGWPVTAYVQVMVHR